ncbi:hypothetical protein BGW36DRAFT_428271 [Talaromyces proteolyticus]|uniref:Uncharacterized protein n=1 Tax=Talaromyces proteolyticus TaxID=1131652 RepID=A0AAD4KMS8_9EURO|nr:uncharacterized protein BGW36DRAFT_428271 [Talaromyces proteolyticus]KAH8696253.1 hypothetical protein BGW36DRAFT_428271 [Talaromyces proteolyticus]
MLLEIELGTAIEVKMQEYPECFEIDRSPILDAELYTALQPLGGPFIMEDTHRLLNDVIGHCLRLAILKPYITEVFGLGKTIYKYIIAPLEELIIGSYAEADLDNVMVSRPTLELNPLASPGTFLTSTRGISRSLENDTIQGLSKLILEEQMDFQPNHLELHRENSYLGAINRLDSQHRSRILSDESSAPITNRHEEYTVGLIRALPIEMAACIAMLDEVHFEISTRSKDQNSYTLGRIGSHNVVIAGLHTGFTELLRQQELLWI